jgi:hypothetical protein
MWCGSTEHESAGSQSGAGAAEQSLPGGVPRVVLRLRIRHWINHADRLE